MSRIIYLFKRIIKLDYKNMFKIAKSISKKAKKNLFAILFDMIYCGIFYQAGYYDYQEFEFYSLNKNERKTYLTRGKNNEIVRLFNDKSYFHKFENKTEFNKIFNKYLKREWLFLEDNMQEFIDFFKYHTSIIVKPIDATGGNGVEKFTYINDEESEKLYFKLKENKQLLIEDCIKQHEKMNLLYENSVNTLRMFTFFKDGKSHFLQAILKIGNGSVVDNFSSGGMYTYVDETGTVFVEAIDRDDNIYYEHPISKTKIVGFKVPMFEEAVNLVKECASIIPEISYVGWDVAISKDGPAIVEGNCFPGVYQVKPSLSNKKEGLIPKYKKIMNIF